MGVAETERSQLTSGAETSSARCDDCCGDGSGGGGGSGGWLAGWLTFVRIAHSDADIDDELQKLYNKRR